MISFLSRVRRAGRSERTAELVPQETQKEQLQIDRKILQDPSSFIDSQVQGSLPLGLTPSTRLPSAGRSSSNRLSKPTDCISVPPVQSGVDTSPRTEPRFTISRISKIAPGGEWSTFGRKRVRQEPDASPPNPNGTSKSYPKSLAEDNRHLSTDSALSTFTLSRLTHPLRTSTGTRERDRSSSSSPSTRSPQRSPDIQYSSGPSSPTNTMSSKQHPRTPQRPSSYTAPASVTTLTSVNQQPTFDSPHTFGHPTPPDNLVKFSVAHSPPPPPPPPLPPLPPLDHPELATALSLRTNPTAHHPTVSTLRDRSNTLPTKRRTPRKAGLSPSLSTKLGRSTRHPPSPMTEQQGTHGRRRARTFSGSTQQRRTSADWSSYQASVGVNSHANRAWPAQVSREILRISLSGREESQGSSPTRGKNQDPVCNPNQSVSSPSFLPFPHPSRPSSPPPPRASATLTDGRETVLPPVLLPRPHSLHFSLPDRRGNRQSDRLTMFEVKRSLSAIEARMVPSNRASGANHASSGLGDPAPTSSDAPRVLLAPTPSPSLFSGRVFSTDAPVPPSMHGEPSTPSPEPRHLSDKGRGKRKAEDNIDLTPPEQKKEAQRATFLLPSEGRSQRVSNSSYAPSSYHRKRARLSSTSPFATPAHSRPASVHETPRSAGRSHYFTSLSSSTGAPMASRTPSRAASTRSRQPTTPSTIRKHERRQSISQVSIPISAYISPHAPSISRSTKFHMRDPRKPPKKPHDTPWGLRFATEDEPGSPIQAWCFFFGFLLFPAWWLAGLLRVPTTRIAGAVDAEKGVAIDDPQIEHDAKRWRFRCRVMAVVSLFTYVPFIVLVAIFAPR